MHEQAQLRRKQTEIEKLGAGTFVVVSFDTHRTRVFKKQNLLLSKSDGPFKNEKSLVYATALSDPAGRAAAIYGVSRKSARWGLMVENKPTWFVIDRHGTLVFRWHPAFDSPDSYIHDVDKVLNALRKAIQD